MPHVVLLFLTCATTTITAGGAGEGEDERGEVTADILVYGASAAGCVAAIAASRSGARDVVVATPYGHVGGMTTGGIMHVDGANSSVIQGITREYFLRVISHYPPENPSGKGYSFACIENRCIEQNAVPGRPGNSSTCDGACAPLAENEWLASTLIANLSDGNRSLTVSIPGGLTHTFLKKSEKPVDPLRNDSFLKVQEGQVLELEQPAVAVDDAYLLIALAASAASTVEAGASPYPPWLQPHAIGCKPLQKCWMYESKVAEQVLEDMLAEANITIVRNLVGLASATKAGTALESVVAEDGTVLRATVWIDGSYEGDLASVSGADMVWGRESMVQYGEHGAGRRPATYVYQGIDPYWPDGTVIPHIYNEPGAVNIFGADDRIEAYDFRLCVTNSPGNRVPFTMPAGYNASEWEFWRRLYKAQGAPTTAPIGACLGPIPNNYSDCGDVPCLKCDILGMKHGTDKLNGAWGYPNGTTAQRTAIRQAHIDYILGLLWFWQTDPATGEEVHEWMKTLGFCKDEYTGNSGYPNDPPNWPYQLYVREARRMVGDFVWTENPISHEMQQERSVGLGSYSFDVHWVTLFVDRNATPAPNISMEGRVNDNAGQDAFAIPYDTLLPKRSQLTNVLVPVASSMSHVRQNAVRMEPTWMIMGHASGVAAAMALRSDDRVVHNISVPLLQRALILQKQMIYP